MKLRHRSLRSRRFLAPITGSLLVVAGMLAPPRAQADFRDDRTTCFGMQCCPSGYVAKVFDAKSGALGCHPLPAGEAEDTQDCFVDHATVTGGMHACPRGTYVRGLHRDKNLLTCCYNQKRGYTGFSDQVAARGGCPAGESFLAGTDSDKGTSLCRTLAPTARGAGATLPQFDPERSRSFLDWRGRVSHSDWKRVARNWLLRILDVEPGAAGTRPPAPVATVISRETLPTGVARLKIKYAARVDGSDVFAYLLLPRGYAGKTGSYQAVLFMHGHDEAGKDGTAVDYGNIHHAGALALAERGFVALAPDTRGFGERKGGMSHYDRTDKYFSRTGHHGFYPQLYTQDSFQAVSFLMAQPGVNPKRVFSAGLSLGGWQSMWIGALDERLSGTIAGGIYFGMSCLNDPEVPGRFGGGHACQTIPSISADVDVPSGPMLFDTQDLGALIAPRPLLAMWGDADKFYAREPYRACVRETSARTHDAYRAVGAAAGFKESLTPGMAHEFDNEQAAAFFSGI